MSPARPRPVRSLRFYGILLSWKILEGFGGVPQVFRIGPHFEHFRFLSLHVSPDCFAFCMTKAKAPKNDSPG